MDFYHLTHRLTATPTHPSLVTMSPSPAESTAGKTTSMVEIALKDLLFIKNALVQAEVSRRRGNTVAVYEVGEIDILQWCMM
ncbi:hypothetical protein EON63_17125 [archaeon]|nr:MAG: hypothetical protein EON63_17125 [archaeon]